jgi:hypothetical protein
MPDVVGRTRAVDIRRHREAVSPGREPELVVGQRTDRSLRIEIVDRSARLLSFVAIHRHSFPAPASRRSRVQCTTVAIARARRDDRLAAIE